MITVTFGLWSNIKTYLNLKYFEQSKSTVIYISDVRITFGTEKYYSRSKYEPSLQGR